MLRQIQRKRAGQVIQRATPDTASVYEPPVVEIKRTSELRNEGYGDIYDWLTYKADKQGKLGLLSFFDELTVEQQKAAIMKMAGTSDKPSKEKFAEAMSTRKNMGFKKTVDWDKFSVASREAKKLQTSDYNADKERHYAAYTAAGSSAALGAAGFSATLANQAGESGAAAAVTGMAPAAAGFSALSSATQVYNAYQNQEAALGTHDSAQNIVGEMGGGLADTTRFTAQSVETGRMLAGAAASSAATVVAGAAGVAGGAAYLASGIAGYFKHKQRKKELRKLAKKYEHKSDDMVPLDFGERGMLEQAALLGADTQRLNRKKSAATAAKGAAMIAGGALLLAGAGPIGWVLLGAAGLIGGAAAIYKYWQKRSRKEEVVDRYLNVNNYMMERNQNQEDKGQRGAARDTLMQQRGFNNVGQCYAHIVTELADSIYDNGVKQGKEDYENLITNIGLEISKDRKEPKPELIAKKLHT